MINLRRMTKVVAGVLLAGLVGLAACARQSATTAPDAGAVAASSASGPIPSGSSAGAAAPSTSSTPSGPYGLVLADRLNQEAAGRPTDTPKAEDVLAAIAKSGVVLEGQAQHLASPIGARFCIGAKSPQHLSMSACEYADVATAAAGRAASAKAFAQVDHRDILVNKKTTLTLLQSPFDAQSQAAHDKAVAEFKKL